MSGLPGFMLKSKLPHRATLTNTAHHVHHTKNRDLQQNRKTDFSTETREKEVKRAGSWRWRWSTACSYALRCRKLNERAHAGYELKSAVCNKKICVETFESCSL